MKEELFTIAQFKEYQHHVFFSNNNDRNYRWYTNKVACRNPNIEEDQNEDDFVSQSDPLTSAEVRSEATKLRNQGKEICGQCMSHMFSDSVD